MKVIKMDFDNRVLVISQLSHGYNLRAVTFFFSTHMMFMMIYIMTTTEANKIRILL